ncbi:MAG: recombination protein RecR [Parcubacteria group bacterium]|nr:recombination protein RecR [Parcubacteria group bacterium]
MFPNSIQNLINQLSQLPDIGPRAATRLVFYLINQEQGKLDDLSSLIKNLKTEIHLCSQCFNITNKNNQLCSMCQDSKRNKEIICLVENILNIIPLEKTKQYDGLYHVLGGLISPSDGIGPDNIQIETLINRIKKSQPQIKEIIFALSPTTEGDTTALYIQRLLKPFEIKITRLGRGLSFGSDLEYIDENTLTSALLGRK